MHSGAAKIKTKEKGVFFFRDFSQQDSLFQAVAGGKAQKCTSVCINQHHPAPKGLKAPSRAANHAPMSSASQSIHGVPSFPHQAPFLPMAVHLWIWGAPENFVPKQVKHRMGWEGHLTGWDPQCHGPSQPKLECRKPPEFYFLHSPMAGPPDMTGAEDAPLSLVCLFVLSLYNH